MSTRTRAPPSRTASRIRSGGSASRRTRCSAFAEREADRATATCDFCDTDFLGVDGTGGGKFETARGLADAIEAAWPVGAGARFVVCTGGEPLLQLDAPLVEALHDCGFRVAIETNGTLEAPRGIDWICVSPKADAPLRLTRGNELKLVYPQEKARPESFESLPFEHFFLQPMDGPARDINTRATIEYCLAHPRWRLSLQSHKIIGIR